MSVQIAMPGPKKPVLTGNQTNFQRSSWTFLTCPFTEVQLH